MSKTLSARASAVLKLPFVRNLAKFQAGTVVMMGMGFVSSVVYSNLLGLERYGLYAIVTAFASLVTIIASFGQETTITTFLSEAVARKNKEEIRNVLAYFWQTTVIATLLYIALILLSPFLAQLLGESKDVGMYAKIAILNIGLQWPAVLVFLMLQIENRVGLVTILENIRLIAQVGLSTILLLMGYGLWGVLAGTCIVSALYVPLCLFLYERFRHEVAFPSMPSVVRMLRVRDTQTYFKQGVWISADRNIAGNLYPNVFFMILSATAGLQAVGLFRLALKLAELPRALIMPSLSRMAAVTIPRLTALDRGSLKRSCVKLLIGSLGLNTLAIIGAAVCVPLFFPLVYGREFIGAIPAFFLLLPGNFFATMQIVAVPLLRLYKKMHVSILNNLAGTAVAVALYFGLSRIIDPLYAMCLASLYLYVNSNNTYLYLWHFLKRKKG